MTSVHAILRWQDVVPETLRGRTVVVIDVLRWSTVVATALANGASALEAFGTSDGARARAMELGRDDVLLGGERESMAIAGFDVGNSPLEYSRGRVAGRTVVTTTTNGTQALLSAVGAAEVLVGAFVNLHVVRARLLDALHAGRGVTLLAAGRSGSEALEDTACVGALAAWLADQGASDVGSSDAGAAAGVDTAGRRAIELWEQFGANASRALQAAPHAASLRAAGFGADISYASQVALLDIVPVASAHRVSAG